MPKIEPRTMKTVMSVTAGAALLAFAASLAPTSTAFAASNECQDSVKNRLERYGIKWADVSNVQWQTNYWQSEGPQRTVSGYQFYGEPKSCTGGSIVVSLNDTCDVSQIYSRGACDFPGMAHVPW